MKIKRLEFQLIGTLTPVYEEIVTPPVIPPENVILSDSELQNLIDNSSGYLDLSGKTFICDNRIEVLKSVVINGGVIDGHMNPSISPTVMVQAKDVTIQNTLFQNSLQYCLEAYHYAPNFKFLNNTLIKQQEGIATGGDLSNYVDGGIIAGNTIRDSTGDGIKLRWAKNIQVYNNIIDVSTDRRNESGGIYLSQGDGACENIDIFTNTITNSIRYPSVIETWGLYCNPSSQTAGLNKNIQFRNNYISDTLYGIWLEGENVACINNLLVGCKYPYVDTGIGNSIFPPIALE